MTFLVSQAHKAVVLNPADPERVLSVVTTAKPLSYKGRTLIAMPYGLDETKVLRNLGIDLPSPIGYFYDWPHDKKMIPHGPVDKQKETAGFLSLYHRAYCFNSIGTGKTISALWAADFLMREGLVRRVMIIGPLSSLDLAWADTIFFNFRHRTCAVLHGTAAKRRKLFAEDHDCYIINPDGLETILHHKKDAKGKTVCGGFLRSDIDLVIIDEGHDFRNANTDMWRALRASLSPSMRVWDLTATPTLRAPTDAWAQCRLVTPDTVPQYFSSFKMMTMQQLTQFKWVPRAGAMDIVYKAMQPAVRFTRDEMFTLPGENFIHQHVELTAAQKKHYKELMDELSTEVADGGQVQAVNEGVKVMKLIQTACGVLYDKFGQHHEIDCKPRVDEVIRIIESCGEKVLVYAPLTGVAHMLHRELSKRWETELVYGATPKNRRNEVFRRFQQDPSLRVIVAHPECMSRSLTLTEASTIVWYAPIDSNYTYTQANGRITRPGQSVTAAIVNISGTEAERRIYKRLETQTALQGVLLDMVQQGGTG